MNIKKQIEELEEEKRMELKDFNILENPVDKVINLIEIKTELQLLKKLQKEISDEINSFCDFMFEVGGQQGWDRNWVSKRKDEYWRELKQRLGV